MAGLCSYNFTVGFVHKKNIIMNDGQNELKGIVGHHVNSFYGYKNERWDCEYVCSLFANLLIIK